MKASQCGNESQERSDRRKAGRKGRGKANKLQLTRIKCVSEKFLGNCISGIAGPPRVCGDGLRAADIFREDPAVQNFVASNLGADGGRRHTPRVVKVTLLSK